MADIFDNKILCKNCNKEMQKMKLERNGFLLRAVKCPSCSSIVLHPKDEQEYEQFSKLKKKTYKVKMRIVGNSYAVSIPKEIVEFMREQEKIMDDMVRLCFSDAKKLNLLFGKAKEKDQDVR
jgi:hypothetical protein